MYESRLVSTRADADALVAEIIDNFEDETSSGIGFDIETEVVPGGAFGFSGEWVTAQFAARNLNTGWSTVAVVEVWKTGSEFMRPLVETNLPLIAHNAGFEALFLRRYGLPVTNWRDTMLADGILRLGTQRFYRSLDILATQQLGWRIEGKDTIRVSFKPGIELTAEQIQYAETDALAVLFIHPQLVEEMTERGLMDAYMLEVGALPAATEMTFKGIPFDAEAWRSEVLAKAETEISAAEAQLAELTGGGAQMDLFGGVQLPWKPDSAVDLRRVLNDFEDPSRLKAVFGERDSGVSVGADDKADSVVLARLANAGSPLASELLRWRHWAKLNSTYGETMLAIRGEDGAFHPSYKQAIVSTGRWASENPNGQNLAPEMKGYFRAPEDHVFIMADYSNMEMRVGASEAKDQVLIEAFVADRDIHSNTAALMFGYDLEEFLARIANKDPDAVMDRKKAKPVNFGNFYGLGAQSLWESFQAEGVDISVEECQKLIEDWYNAYPGVKAWVAARDQFVTECAASLPYRVDWHLTDQLDLKTKSIIGAKAWLKRKYGRRAYPEEIVATDKDLSYEDIRWVESFGEPVLLDREGRPLEFVSTTVSGRQRRFQIGTEGWFTAQLHIILGSRKSKPQAILDRWAADSYEPIHLKLRSDGSATRKAIELAFSNKTLKRRFVRWIWQTWPERALSLREEAAAAQIRKMTNAYRNAPVQGGAAEPMLSAIGSLWLELREKYPDAYIVQTVHDSLVLLAPKSMAAEVADRVRYHMEQGFYRFFDSVPIKVDIEIGETLLPAEKSETTWDLEEFRNLMVSEPAA